MKLEKQHEILIAKEIKNREKQEKQLRLKEEKERRMYEIVKKFNNMKNDLKEKEIILIS